MIDNIRIGRQLIKLDKPLIMSILNTTPDSFYSGSRIQSIKQAVIRVEEMIQNGADIIDIGGYSSRPGATNISVNEELERVIPVINEVLKQFPNIIVSCDTFRSEVAKQALDNGALLINDISGGTIDPSILDVVAEFNATYVLMHSKGTPQTMQSLSNYSNLLNEIWYYFTDKINQLTQKGIKDIILDPGFGFAKDLNQNYALFSSLSELNHLKKPILVGISRKSMIYNLLKTKPEESLNGTSILNCISILKGAKIIRVHDTKEANELVQIISKIDL
jgi:dihydropteroate synthase